jgi:general secretion pathway protein M
MMHGAFTLPDGKRGQALAAALTLLATALLWMSTAGPLIGWYEARRDELVQQRSLAAHLAALGAQIPALRQAVNTAGLQSADDQVLLTGDSDVIAGANLQTALQGLAIQAGTSLDSAALQPVQADGAVRRISMQVSVTATWPVLIALWSAIGTARPRMVIGQLSLSTGTSTQPGSGQEQPVQASFSVTGFRAGTP